jgi:hypothetical protein
VKNEEIFIGALFYHTGRLLYFSGYHVKRNAKTRSARLNSSCFLCTYQEKRGENAASR